MPISLEQAKRDAEKHVIVSKNITTTSKGVDHGTVQGVTTSKTRGEIQIPKPRMPSPAEKLQSYLKSIGTQ
jgi:hypothetical protein